MSEKLFEKYEAIIGIEVHAELKTATKIFCSCSTNFGKEPNTLCCPVCMGLPGALPVLNRNVIDLAIRAGLALDCEISSVCYHHRKNYFYPDLPKAYQISQDDTPLCYGGHLDVSVNGEKKSIRIQRIHIEEDAGKLIHRGGETHIDYNRCGVPLIEIVSSPDIRSGAEAKAYLEELRLTLLYAGVSDCKMNEGSMRCDVNLSVRKRGDDSLNARTEIKNLNSFAFAAKAIEYEFLRQAELMEKGEAIRQETRRYDEKNSVTLSMRSKENAPDYRYFPDPDLPPFTVDRKHVEKIRSSMPILPRQQRERLTREYGLSESDTEIILSSPESAEYFLLCAPLTKYPRILASLIVCEFPVIMKGAEHSCPIDPKNLASLCDIRGDGKINSSTVKSILKELFENDTDPVTLISEKGLSQIDGEEELLPIVDKVISECQKAVDDYKKGKTAAARSIVGRVMGATSGRANPTLAAELVEKRLSELLNKQ